jgi:uncharacterized protein YdcH (DUF465 family)
VGEIIQRIEKMAVDLNDPEIKAAIEEALASASSEQAESIKNLHKENAKWRRLAQGKDSVDSEMVEKLEAERDEALKVRDESQKALKKLTQDFEKVTNDYKSETAFTQKLLVQNGLTEAFMQAGVQDQDYIDLLVTKHSQNAKVIIDGESRKVMFGDKDKDAFINEWKQTDAAKKVIAAPVNGGGGANGGSGNGGGGKQMTRAQFDSLDATSKASAIKDGATITD